MPYTIRDAKRDFTINPIVQEFIARKMILITYAVSQDFVKISADDIREFKNKDLDNERVEICVNDKDIPKSAKLPMKLLAQMSSIPCDLFFISDNEDLSEKEIKDILEINLFNIKSFMSIWNMSLECSNIEVPAFCEKFTSL